LAACIGFDLSLLKKNPCR